MKANSMPYPHFILQLPDWIDVFLPDPDKVYPTVEDRMRLVIELSRLNFVHGTGGPFGAGIFDLDTHKLIAPGVNLVVCFNCCVLHAEIVALMIAQQVTQCYDLAGEGMPPCEMVVSTEPCAMCLGAIPWSGIRRLVCGARDEDARSIGFDEGEKVPDWIGALAKRNISVERNVCRLEARAVLREYFETGGIIYNSRQQQILCPP
jgi:tRNA(Arg) A34 adenosine deaminase TadA